MNPVKVYWNGKRLRDIYPHATRWQVFKWKLGKFFRKVLFILILTLIVVVIFELGNLFGPKTVIYTKQEIIKEVPIDAPILEKIADCESGKRLPNGKAVKGSASHWGASGQVLMTGNNNKSVDVGKYAINSVWFPKATELGLDITKEADNKTMAQWIYENRGTEDWYPSKSCWK